MRFANMNSKTKKIMDKKGQVNSGIVGYKSNLIDKDLYYCDHSQHGSVYGEHNIINFHRGNVMWMCSFELLL